MKIIKFEFSIQTRNLGSKVSQVMELQFDEGATDEEIEEQVNEIYNEWLVEKNLGGWEKL